VKGLTSYSWVVFPLGGSLFVRQLRCTTVSGVADAEHKHHATGLWPVSLVISS